MILVVRSSEADFWWKKKKKKNGNIRVDFETQSRRH